MMSYFSLRRSGRLSGRNLKRTGAGGRSEPFAKVMGVSKDTKEYWNRLHTAADYQETHMIRSFPFTEELKANYQYHYSQVLNEKERLTRTG